jgi:hypothetical protein
MKKTQQLERARKASRSTEEWLWLNYEGIKEPALREFVAPFPPEDLRAVMGALSEVAFARQGVRIYKALMAASPVPWGDCALSWTTAAGTDGSRGSSRTRARNSTPWT